MFLQENEALQYLYCVVLYLIRGEADKPSCFQVLKQVGMKQFKNETMMLSKVSLIDHPYYIMLVIWILLHYVFQILSFLIGKLVIHFRIPRNLDGELVLVL